MPGVWVAIVLLVFIVIPWALSYFCVRKGYMPLKSGGKIERATDPVNFWISVGFYALIGTTFFIFNLWLSWQVLSRQLLEPSGRDFALMCHRLSAHGRLKFQR